LLHQGVGKECCGVGPGGAPGGARVDGLATFGFRFRQLPPEHQGVQVRALRFGEGEDGAAAVGCGDGVAVSAGERAELPNRTI
jgi:hypothetical protein